MIKFLVIPAQKSSESTFQNQNLKKQNDGTENSGLKKEKQQDELLHSPSTSSKGTKNEIEDYRKAEKRINVVSEIISSEKSYLDHVNVLIRHFVDPLQISDIISATEVKTLFGEIRSIRLVNQVLFDHLSTGDIIGAFATLTPFLKLYSSYARNFPSSQHLLQELHNKRKGFSIFLRKQEDLVQVRGLKLPALLIMPVQRIPRYKLLLEELRQCLEAHCEEFQLNDVLSKLNEVADYVNECVSDYDNSITVLSIQKRLDSYAPKLLVPGRKFIKEGSLKKVCRHGNHKMQDRMFWLFSDILIYGKENPRKKNQYLCSCVLPLKHCYVERMFGKNMFKISCKGELLLLYADEFFVVDSWLSTLETAIQNLRETRLTLRKDSSRLAPQKRKILNSIRKRRSSLSEKLRTRHLQHKCEAKPSQEGKFRCKWLASGMQEFVRGKRRRGDSPVGIKGVRYTELIKNMEEKRPRLSCRPRLETLAEEDSDMSMCTKAGDVSVSFSEIAEPDGDRKPNAPWWAAYEEKSQNDKRKQRNSLLSYCSII